MEVRWTKGTEDGAAREKRGRPKKRRYMDALVEDMKAAEVQEIDTQNKTKWKQSIRCGDP